jgi:hypothetical protein
MRIDWISNWWPMILGGLLLGALLTSGLLGCLDPNYVQTAVLAVTAIIILWYTVETMRVRREAESRARRDREPLLYFEVKEFSKMAPDPGQGFHFAFNLTNQSTNSALAHVRMRLKSGSQDAVLPSNPPYNGKQIWEITPFFQISGWFDLMEMFERIPRTGSASPGLTGEMLLNVQVDLYWPNRKRLGTIKKEYRIRVVPPQNVMVEFYQEVATSLPVLGCPDALL